MLSATSASLLVSALSYLLLYSTSSILPLFDKSPLLTTTPLTPLLYPLLRWDSFHFLHIAHSGYLYEHEWAFFPGTPILTRYLPPTNILFILVLAAVACDSSRTLYLLSLHHLQSHTLAYMTLIISLLSSSPVTVRLVPYSEPFFTYLSYKGMFYCTGKKWLLATISFTLASSFRSNGFLLSGYILWGMILQPLLAAEKLAMSKIGTAILFTSMVFMPFVYHNYIAYLVFCKSATHVAPAWCVRSLPSIYTYTQSRYWNVGFLRYWSFSQLPNFIIAAPLNRNATDCASMRFYNLSLFPHLVHSVILSCMLLLNAHAQIILRLAPSMPIVYWAVARLIATRATLGRQWVTWCTIWGIVSIILWTSFLPPA
ncbi:glycosyltransferase family 76 protein [Amanita rubescens]|nr:glycosyltransferase family 76 protein [Amanita rubescens]